MKRETFGTVQKDILRFIACGSVDDGKSTFIGRLLYDTGSVYDDQLEMLEKESKSIGNAGGGIDFSLLVDGLSSEREQGITIDVAYRYFETAKRKFIIADTPGHEQYTRNMATAASNADLAVILIDAKNGVMKQSRRHAYIAASCGIRHAVVAVNKMDVVGYDQKVFEQIKTEFTGVTKGLGFSEIHFVPVSAREGENIVTRSKATPWYGGESLLEILQGVTIAAEAELGFRLPVQYVNRPDRDFRGFCGTIASGGISLGETIRVYPSEQEAVVNGLVVQGENKNSAGRGEAVTLVLDREIDISRGDMIVASGDVPDRADTIVADLVWMDARPLEKGREYYIKHAGATFTATVREVVHKVDIARYEKEPGTLLEMNDIGRAVLWLSKRIVFDPYTKNKITGSFILIDRITHAVSGAGMIESGGVDAPAKGLNYSEYEVQLNRFIRETFPHWEAKNITQE